MNPVSSWTQHEKQLIHCTRCPRLRTHCQKVSLEKRRSFQQDAYWGKPVPGFGDKNARLVIVGLAPAAHGANRTGRMFTGDRSGDWLYEALYAHGFANQAHSSSKEDGLSLKDVYITAAVRCAPPENLPTPEEIQNCASYLDFEIKKLSSARVFLALGQIAYRRLLRLEKISPIPPFQHGLEQTWGSRGYLLCSYHPSQQNTFTGRLTQSMFHSVFKRARELLPLH